MARPIVQPWPRVAIGPQPGNDGNAPWIDPSYIPSGPMRTTGRPSLPMPGNVPSGNAGAPVGVGTNYVSDAWHQATIVSSSVAPAAVANADQQPFLLAPTTQRNLLMFRNASAGGQNILIEFGKPASAVSVLLLVPNQVVLFDEVVSQDDLYAACDVAGGVLAFGYSTIGNPQ